MEIRQYKRAEKVVLLRMEEHPADAQLRYILAQIQWLRGQKVEARVNYTQALLQEPCRVPIHRILYQPLLRLIEEVGAEMSPAYGWVRGVLKKLVPVKDSITICSESHRRGVECYQLIRLANKDREKSSDKRDKNAFTQYKIKLDKLKAEAPGLFDEYLALFVERDG